MWLLVDLCKKFSIIKDSDYHRLSIYLKPLLISLFHPYWLIKRLTITYVKTGRIELKNEGKEGELYCENWRQSLMISGGGGRRAGSGGGARERFIFFDTSCVFNSVWGTSVQMLDHVLYSILVLLELFLSYPFLCSRLKVCWISREGRSYQIFFFFRRCGSVRVWLASNIRISSLCQTDLVFPSTCIFLVVTLPTSPTILDNIFIPGIWGDVSQR